jgi:transcription factor WhiB
VTGRARSTTRDHGRAKYVVERCRCDKCRAANTAYERDRARRIEPAYVGASAARQHVEWLTSQGVGLKTIAKVAGLSHSALPKLMYGDKKRKMPPSKRLRPATAQAILAVTPVDAAAGTKVPAGPTLGIVDQLVARGWTRRAIAEAIGQTRALQLGNDYVTRRNADAIKALLDQPVPPRRSRWGTHQPPPPELADAPGPLTTRVTDGDRFVLEVVELLEERIDHRDWHAEAACRGRPPWMWFPPPGDRRTIKAAKKVCGACFVRDRCLAVHLGDPEGIYGGLTAHERKARRRKEAAA